MNRVRKGIVGVLVVTMVTLPIACSASDADATQAYEPMISFAESSVDGLTYAIVDTGQTGFYDENSTMKEPNEGQEFYGQDANYTTNPSSYTDNGDGTITDNVTGLMWQKDAVEKKTYDEAMNEVENSTLAGYDDWRMTSIKELYSLINFNGKTGMSASGVVPYIDDDYFTFYLGDESAGERYIDAQYMSSTKYVSTTMNGAETVFGVNFVDGRIKGYGLENRREGTDKEFYTLFVRGNTEYGENNFVDNGDGTVTDLATGLMWMQGDSGTGMNWEEALEYAETAEFAGYGDWKLPDAKELQSIVDYERSLDTTNSAAIAPVFDVSEIIDEGGNKNYPFYWSSTTHLEGRNIGGGAVYVAFGEALGFMDLPRSDGAELMDVHGAGAQRSDPKVGNVSDYLTGFGPQGDVRRIDNHVRLVRVVDAGETSSEANPNVKGTYEDNEAISTQEADKTDEKAVVSEVDMESLSGFGTVLIGTGSPVPSEERSSPSTLIYLNDNYFLVDMGEGTQDRLNELELNIGDIETLMFTHHHLDHNEEYSGIAITGWLKGRNHMNLIGPTGTKALHEFTAEFYKEDMEYRASKKNRWSWNGMTQNVDITEVDGDSAIEVNGVKITTTEVPHTIQTQAYRFDAIGQSIVVSGDTKYSESLIDLAKDADMLIIDSGSIIRVGSKGKRALISNEDNAHASLTEVAQMAEKANVKKLVLTHIGGDIDEEAEIAAINEIYGGEVVVGADLMVVEP